MRPPKGLEGQTLTSSRSVESSTSIKRTLTSLRWVGRALDHQHEEIRRFRNNMSSLSQAMDALDISCAEYLEAQSRIEVKVKNLRGKSLRLARLANSGT
jgi:hypothetical protein